MRRVGNRDSHARIVFGFHMMRHQESAAARRAAMSTSVHHYFNYNIITDTSNGLPLLLGMKFLL